MEKEKLETLYREHRPALHFSSRTGWINDPNGLIFYEGYYHLFYQYYPNGVTHGLMHWGHTRTRDFLEWEELPIALYPDEKGTIFSGSMVYDKANTGGFGSTEHSPLVAIFTQNLETEETRLQYQSLAYSMDGGRSFEKYEKNPVLDLGLKNFRDPKVFWYAPTEKWVMLVTAGQEIRFFTSDNLKQWNADGIFRVDNLKPDTIWECPDLAELSDEQGEKHWVLIVSQNTLDYMETGIRYFTGIFDGECFYAETGVKKALFVDFGRDNYAAATYAETEGRVIQQSWMNCWAYAQRLPEAGFRGSMTIPREIGLRKTPDGYRMVQRVVKEVRRKLLECTRFVPEKAVTKIAHIPGIYHLMPKQEGVKIVLRNKESQITINVDFTYGKIIVDRSGCADVAYGPCFQEAAWKYFDIKSGRELYIVLDVTSMEIFAAGGEAVGTFQYFTEVPLEEIVTGGSE